MGSVEERSRVGPGVMSLGKAGWGASAAAFALVSAGAAPALAAMQQPGTAATSLVFDKVTVVDVEQGKLVPDQRVVIVGNRIQAMGSAPSVSTPRGAKVVDAQGKYLIPGLWDLHVHPRHVTDVAYPLYLANGVTGIRDAGSPILIDTLIRWRREILAGTRVGPPRQILSGQSIAGPRVGCDRSKPNPGPETCVADAADARYYVDSLRKAGADMIKPRAVRPEIFFVIAAEARRLGIPFGGHPVTASITMSDSGSSLIDHQLVEGIGNQTEGCHQPRIDAPEDLAQCKRIVERLRRNNTWFVPTRSVRTVVNPVGNPGGKVGSVSARILTERLRAFWSGARLTGNWLHDSATSTNAVANTPSGSMALAQRVDLPILAGTDGGEASIRTLTAGFTLHTEIATFVEEGLTTLNALQSATLNPAKMLRATDSMGTVAPGKLADLVLLDANPLADITNTTAIRAVVANGRYFDRTALDEVLAGVQAKAKGMP